MSKALIFLTLTLAALGSIAEAQDTITTTTTSETTESEDRRISPGGLFLEPILMASSASSSIKTSQLAAVSDDTSGTVRGLGLGLRFGVHISEIIFLAADGRYQRAEFTDSFYNSSTGDAYNYGPTLGVQMPVAGLRAWGGYVLGGEYNPGAGVQGLDLKFRNARGYRLGAGIHIASISANLEYENLVYDNTDIESFGSLAVNDQTNVDFSTEAVALSLSFPVEL